MVRVSFSGEHLGIVEVAKYHKDVESAIRLYFSEVSPNYGTRFLSYQICEVIKERDERIEELERTATFTILASLEAAFRIDYLNRVYKKKKDNLSRAFRTIHGKCGENVALERVILQAWMDDDPSCKKLIGELKGAFKYRHWMAHGRYWNPKLGRKYDYYGIYTLAQMVIDRFPLMT